MVEFKDEDFVRKAVDTMNKHDLSGRPLNIKEVRPSRRHSHYSTSKQTSIKLAGLVDYFNDFSMKKKLTVSL